MIAALLCTVIARADSMYAGSASCRKCHQEEFAEWDKSNHHLAERPLNCTNDAAAIRSGIFATSIVQRVLGRDPLEQFLVSFSGGRLQATETARDVHRQDWFDIYGSEHRQPGEWGHWTGRGMNWNSMCAACHNTGLQKNYDETTDTYHTTMAEMGVGCEACHGPLNAHNEWQKQFGKSGKADPTVPRLSRTQFLDTCGSCHSRRGELDDGFVPGERFQDHFDLDIVDGSDNFYPDGQIHQEDYEYASFLGSRMHAAGVTCANCHNPHSGKVRLPGNWLCLQCHSGAYPNAPIINPVRHSHHLVRGYNNGGRLVETDLSKYNSKNFPETGGECINCHMPQTVYMQRHARHDHGFTIPDPLLTKEFGIPNACNRCHQDQSVDWALAAIENWYGKHMERPTRGRAEALARGRIGDASAIDPLLQILTGNETPYWKAAAINLLEPWSEQPNVRAALLANFDHTNSLVRTRAVHALEENASLWPEVATALHAKLADDTRSVRVAAAWSLRDHLEFTNAAMCDLENSLRQNADQPAGQMQRGAFYLARNDLTNSLISYEKAVAWDTRSAPLRHDLAIVFSLMRRDREALEQMQEAVRLEPNEAEYHYKLALAWNALGDSNNTIAELRNAVRLNPNHARAKYNLALALKKGGEKNAP